MPTNWEQGFVAFAEAQGLALRNLAYLLCGDWHRAEDHAQTALLRLYRHWRRIERTEEVGAYARRVLVRTVLADRRRRWSGEHATDTVPEVTAPYEPVDDRIALAGALARLAPRQRAVVVLRYWGDLSVTETARVLGVSEGTVKSTASRALHALRGALEGLRDGAPVEN